MANRGAEMLGIALTYEGTPFFPRGREPGRALDCAGVVACALEEMGIDCPSPEYTLAPFHDHVQVLENVLSVRFDQVDLADTYEPGDVLVFRTRRMPNHTGVVVSGNVVLHSVPGQGVTTTPMDYDMESQIRSAWRLKEIT